MIDFNKAVAAVRALESKCAELEGKVVFERKRADKAEEAVAAFNNWYRSGPGYAFIVETDHAWRLSVGGKAIVVGDDGRKRLFQYHRDGKPVILRPESATPFFDQHNRYWTEADLVAARLAFSDDGGEMLEVPFP